VAPGSALVADIAALVLAAAAAVIDRDVLVGTFAVAAVVAIQRIVAAGPPRRAAVLGAQQTLLGLGVVVATAVGVLVAG
jgi:hypothetical protein